MQDGRTDVAAVPFTSSTSAARETTPKRQGHRSTKPRAPGKGKENRKKWYCSIAAAAVARDGDTERRKEGVRVHPWSRAAQVQETHQRPDHTVFLALI